MENKEIRTVLIDDEQNALDSLKNIIDNHCPEIKVLGMATSVKEGVELLEQIKPELLFLDIFMPDGSGFDLLNSIKNRVFEVVFVTAYDEFAIRAFDFSAIHYILKPYKYEQIVDAIKRFEQIKSQGNIIKRLDSLEHNLVKEDKQLVLPTNTEMMVINEREIIYCESSDNYTIFHLKEGKKIIVTKPLYHYEKLLGSDHFFRIHTRYLINLKYLKSYVKGRGGFVLMKGGAELDVAIRKKKDFMDFLSRYF